MNILSKFIKDYINLKLNNNSSVYLLDTAEYFRIDELPEREIIPSSIRTNEKIKYENQIRFKVKNQYDALVSFPVLKKTSLGDNKLHVNYKGRNFYSIVILNSLNLINDNGVGIYLVPQGLFNDDDFFDCLELAGFNLNTILNVPSKMIDDIRIDLYFITISSKVNDEDVFVSKINVDYEQNVDLMNAMVIDKFSLAKYGELINSARGFNYFSFIMNKEVNNLLENYPYNRYLLSEFCIEIGNAKPNDDDENALYISRIGTRIFTSLDCEDDKYKYYFILKLNKDKIFSQYLYYFLKSEIGQLILKSYTMGAHIPQLNLKKIRSIKLPLPSFEMQVRLAKEQDRLHILSEEIEKYSNEITYKPESIGYISDAVKGLENVFKDSDKTVQIKNLISKGETKYIEFKSAFTINELGEEDKAIQMKSVRAIASFLNSEGGILLIGVDDDGSISGLNNEPYKNGDKLTLAFKDKIKDKIGESVFIYVYYELIEIDGKTIMFVECTPSEKPVFITEKKTDYFYIKVSNSTETLRRQEMLEYINKRFYFK